MRTFRLYTNRSCLIFDHDDSQDVEAQNQISCYHMGKNAQSVLDSCDVFYLSKWQTWSHNVSKKKLNTCWD